MSVQRPELDIPVKHHAAAKDLQSAAQHNQPRQDEINRFQLLESGEQYFPEVFAAIAAAQREIIVETFIWFDDAVGRVLHRELLAAAQRGVQIDVTIDGYGSPDFPASMLQPLLDAGVRMHIYDPRPRILGLRTNLFRRMHRKIVVVDGALAFVGGINFAVDQMAGHASIGKLDFAVRVQGPLVRTIHEFAQQQAALFVRDTHRGRRFWLRPFTRRTAATTGFVVRDNQRHRDDIERCYIRALRAARQEVIVCNAYFFPGFHLLRELRRAARRGVAVHLILQGSPDMPAVKRWEELLYPPLLRAGVVIHEYMSHPLHAKVAVVDTSWSTVGSSNLDPLSLALNLEANVIIQDEAFIARLRQRLWQIAEKECRVVASMPGRYSWRVLVQTLVYHATRHFPTLAGWLPAHTPKLYSPGLAEFNDATESRSTQ